MAQTTYPNQRTVRIHREAVKSDFLGIKNENWQAASRDLGPHGLRLYLYLAANADGFNLALSPADARQKVGIPRSTYGDQFQVLLDKGYLVQNHGNTYDFYEVPMPQSKNLQTPCPGTQDIQNNPPDGTPHPCDGYPEPPGNREININTPQPNTGINRENNVEIYKPKDIEIRIPVPGSSEKEIPDARRKLLDSKISQQEYVF